MLARLQQHATAIALTGIVWHELHDSCARLAPSARRTRIERYLAQVIAPTLPILPYDSAAAVWHAHERARLEALGRSPAFVDGQIGAIAATNQLVLVTFNTADFVAFAGLAVEDWRV